MEAYKVTQARPKLPPLEFSYEGIQAAPYKTGSWPTWLAIVNVEDSHECWALDHSGPGTGPKKEAVKELRRFYKEQHGMEAIDIRIFNQTTTIKADKEL